MEKVTIPQVVEAIKAAKVDMEAMKAIIEKLQEQIKTASDANAGEEPPPKQKKQHVVVVFDPDDRFSGLEVTAAVVQIPETESPATVMDRIFSSAYDFNATRRGRMHPIETVGDGLGSLSKKITAEHDLWITTKEPVQVVVSNNQIPKDQANHIDHRRGTKSRWLLGQQPDKPGGFEWPRPSHRD